MTALSMTPVSRTDLDTLIDTLTYSELNDVRLRIAERMKHMREIGVEQIRSKFLEEAAALGLSPEDILAPTRKQRRKKRRLQIDDVASEVAF